MYWIRVKNGRPTTYDVDEKTAAALEAVIVLMPPMPTIEIASFSVPEPKPAKKRKKAKFTMKRKCAICGKSFVIKGPTQRLCSPACVKANEKAKA
jgi:hypothetical protein